MTSVSPPSEGAHIPRVGPGVYVGPDYVEGWHNVPAHVRRAVATRFGCPPGGSCATACAYCGAPGRITWRMTLTGPSTWHIKFPGLHLEHIYPYSRGGSNTDPDNFTLACPLCNARKGNSLPSEWQVNA